MKQNLTKVEAYRLFGKLYGKPRPPAIQEQVEKIVSENSNIFARIKKIQDVDRTEEIGEKNISTKKTTSVFTHSRREISKKPSKTRKKESQTISFFRRLFGGSKSKLLNWGRSNGTIVGTAFHIRISEEAKKNIEIKVSEEDIINTIKAFRLAISSIWEWNKINAEMYNTILVTYQFFTENIKFKNLFSVTEEPAEWLERTMRMQKYFMQLLKYPNYKTILLKILPKYIQSIKQGLPLVYSLQKSITQILFVIERKPSLKNTLVALYVLTDEKIYSWKELEGKMGVTASVVDRFLAPKQVEVLIKRKIKDLKVKEKIILNEISEITKIRKQYLAIKEDNSFDSQFLDELIFDVIRRTYGEKNAVSHVVKSYKNQPHRLLFAILRDYNITYLPLLSSSVIGQGKDNKNQTIYIFSSQIGRQYFDQFNEILRAMDSFLRRYPGLNYSFVDFAKNSEDIVGDAAIDTLLRIIKEANAYFRKVIFDIQFIVNSHERGIKEINNDNSDRNQPIDNLEDKSRLIPYSNFILSSSSRLNGNSIFQNLINLLMHSYNYLYIFRDAGFFKILHSSAEKQKEQKNMMMEIKRLEGSKGVVKDKEEIFDI